MPEPLTPDRLAEIRERHAKALEGPYKPEWDSCDCGPEDGCRNGQRWIHALRMPVPKTTNHTGTPPAWEYLYSEMSEVPADTVLMFAHAREDVCFLLAEVDRLSSLSRLATDRYNELGQLRDAVHREGDTARAERLSFAMQEIRDLFIKAREGGEPRG
jgi:hypothetical protein